MKNCRTVLVIALLAMTTPALAQVEFRLAYTAEAAGALPAAFPNDQRYRFMAETPYVGSSEVKAASVSMFEGRAVVLLRMTEGARKKVNRLTAANLNALAGPDDAALTGLAMMVEGQVHSVLETVHRLHSSEMLVVTGDDRLPVSVQLDNARALVKRMNLKATNKR